MKTDDLFNGITGIRDDQVMEAVTAKKAKKRRRLPWAMATAAVLAIAILAALVSGPLRTTGYALAEVRYPASARYSEKEDQYALWREENRQRYAAAEGLEHAADPFQTALLSQLLLGDGENRVCSPLNVYLALSMLAETAGGSSRDQILTLLDCPDMDTLRDRAQRLWTANYVDDGLTASRLASSLWLGEGLSYNQDTVDTLARQYYAASFQGEMGSDGLNRALQDWLNENTGNLLKDAAQQMAFTPNTRMALAATVYFRARWNDEFYPKGNTREVFHTPTGDETVEMMHHSYTMVYYRGAHFGAISQSLKNGGEMLFVLPDEGYTPEDLLREGEVLDFFNQYPQWEQRESLKVNLSLPKFDVSSNLDLLDSLQALGISDILDPYTADFTPLLPDSRGTCLSSAAHAARVSIDEEGVEAAAYTVLEQNTASLQPPEQKIDFILDRPFLFSIYGGTGSLLFAGAVNRP